MMTESAAMSRFFDQVRQRGFAVTPGPIGEYLVREAQSAAGSEPRRLILDERLFDEYVDTAVDGWELPPGSTDRTEEVISLMVVNLEAAISSVDAEGRNHVTELGIRRDATGSAHWYQIEDTSADAQATPPEGGPELRWVGERPS